ncbi:MAG: AraC family transcriptional regulator [Epulopiscium sp.]|nr:AraC family transcriptional regulator [Candidatus Epulonipiscium sp.]
MNEKQLNYQNENGSFSVTHRKALSHNMPYNHFHSSYELFYLISGERCFFIKDRTIRIKEGDLVIIQPNILHKTTNSDLPKHERIIINFQDDFLMPLHVSDFDRFHPLFKSEYSIIRFSLHNRIYVEEIFNRIIQELQEKNTGYEVYSQTLILQLLIFCCRYLEQNNVEPLEYPSPIHERISEIVRYINNHYTERLTLEGVADQFYISPYYLSRAFKEATGFTFIEYVNSVRIKEAKKLLEQSNLKVKKIAGEVGFGSITHFGRVFKEVTGHTPLYYRKAFK